jgi:P27 family predicted phage terminase small subunit
MGARGPAPKATQLKILQGTYRPDRANANEASPSVPDSLDAPSFLHGAALDKWSELAPILIRNGLLTECDLDTLTLYCQTWARYVEAETRLQTEGSTTTAQSGYQQVSAWVTISKNTRADLLKLGDRLGLNPSSRSRINITPQAEESDGLLA